MQFDTTRSEVGDLLFKLKNRADQTVVPDIADTAADFLRSLGEELDILVPVRPSTHRAVQPVTILAEAIGERLNLPVADCVKKTRETPQLKNVYDLDERTKLLSGAFGIDKNQTTEKRILLFDDLYRSGATMNAITSALFEIGAAKDVVAFTITRTRSNQ